MHLSHCSIGANSKYLINRTDEEWVFMLHERRVWYMSKRLKDMAVHFARDSLRGVALTRGPGRSFASFWPIPTAGGWPPHRRWLAPVPSFNSDIFAFISTEDSPLRTAPLGRRSTANPRRGTADRWRCLFRKRRLRGKCI